MIDGDGNKKPYGDMTPTTGNITDIICIIKFDNLLFDNLSGVKIAAKTKPIIIAVIDTAIVIRVA